jgi:CBS domain-containing protein
MQIKEVMTRGVVVIDPACTLQEAGQKMKDLDIGALPVWENNRLVGMVTDRDIVVRSVCAGHDPRIETVRDVMTPEVVFCVEDQDLDNGVQFMKQKQVRRLAVLNSNKQVVGILSLGDLALNPNCEDEAGMVLRSVSEPGWQVNLQRITPMIAEEMNMVSLQKDLF